MALAAIVAVGDGLVGFCGVV